MPIRSIPGAELAETLAQRVPGAVVEADAKSVWVEKDKLLEVVRLLRDDPAFAMEMPEMITATDYIDYFEMVYVLTSLSTLQQVMVKTRLYDRTQPQVASLVPLYKGAELQENEVYDLFGIEFVGHPHPRRIFMWDGFPGWPLRKDFYDFDHRQIEGMLK